MGCFIATPCLFVSGREIPCLYVSEREIYDLLFTFAISAHGSKIQLTAYAQKPWLAIAIIMDSTNEEWMMKKLMLN